ncbi:unnamed protein product [Schistosoma guineensis]|nr:unnamed protein product [Schistosoma guineensis]
MQSIRLLNLLPSGSVIACSLRLVSTTNSSPPHNPDSKTQKTVESIKNEKNKSTGTIYNVPEYYEHKTFGFYDLEIQLKGFRLPQPNPS